MTNLSKNKTSLKDAIEFFVMGASFIFVGTLIAGSVYAQANKTSCATNTNQTADAMCTVAQMPAADSKICFGSHHPRCFILKGDHLVQLLQGSTISDEKLNSTQQATVKTSLSDFVSWIEAENGKQPKKPRLCKESISVDLQSQHKELCLMGLTKKETDEKTARVLATLENPTARKTTSTK